MKPAKSSVPCVCDHDHAAHRHTARERMLTMRVPPLTSHTAYAASLS